MGIECQGEQHFKGIDFHKKDRLLEEKAFKYSLSRDIHKYNVCNDKGIKLLYFIPKKFDIYNYKNNEKYGGIYTDDNVCCTLDELKEKIGL